MARVKIDYGIDLGTTNSSIARMENGESIVKQTKNLMDTLPSCVYFSVNKKGEHSLRVGLKAKDSVYSDAIMALSNNVPQEEYGYLEFKREMGSDKKYSNKNMPKATYSPEELSAEVLKELKSLINDEVVNSVVITVPAMFNAIQKDATMRAAKLAGFKQCELLQEPIAASMAYGLSCEEKDGKWIVFDFGGGTFDAALVMVEDGILTIRDTEGDNYLGGKNLDEEVVNKILLPHLKKEYSLGSYEQISWKKKALLDALKGPAEEMRIALSFSESTDYSTYDRNLNLGQDDNGDDIDLEITITRNQLEKVVKPQYQKAVDICKNLLSRNGLTGEDISSLILVGGPTFSPIIRSMLREQVTQNVDTSINPMTAVARGAALYASTIDAKINVEEIKEESGAEVVFLQVGYPSTSVETSVWVSVNIDSGKTGMGCPTELTIEFQRTDGAWRSDKTRIDTNGNVIETFLLEGKSNQFKILASDSQGNIVKTFPDSFAIIQGVKIGAATLPRYIGIAIHSDVKKRGVFKSAEGLEKNKPLPAVGIVRDRKTLKELRPGIGDDILSILVYQAGYNAEGKSVSSFIQIGKVEVTGDDVGVLIPKYSNVDVTLYVNSSEMMSMKVHFPIQDCTIEKEFKIIPTSIEEVKKWVSKELKTAQNSIDNLMNEGISVEDLRSELATIEVTAQSDDVMRTQSNLKELLLKIEEKEDSTEWERLEAKLRNEFSSLEKAQNKFGDEKTQQAVNQLHQQTDIVIRKKDTQTGYEVLDQITSLYVHLTLVYQCMGVIEDSNKRFGSIQWKDTRRARELVNKGLQEISNQPTVDRLHPIACNLIELMPEDIDIGIGIGIK